MNKPEARYMEIRAGSIRCRLCPRGCVIPENRTGICGVRMNDSGKPALPYYGMLSAVAADPVEKKPLYHFYPGRMILSAGFYGCSFRCPFCQNYHISQLSFAEKTRTFPEDLVETAIQAESFAIAYTYSEPTVHFEYITETAAIARKKGIKNVLVTNGYLNPEPASEMLSLMDAVNVDLKSFREEFYQKEIGGHVNPVLDFIRTAHSLCHVEVTTLVIQGKNDSRGEIGDISGFIASIDRNIPLHLSAYHPAYKYTIPSTGEKLIMNLVDLSKQKLRYVYPGNIPSAGADTFCPSCGALWITRRGYHVSIPGITGEPEKKECASCGLGVPFPV